MFESLVLLNSTVIVGGDINIHVEDITDADGQRLASVFDVFDVQQHVTGPTHLLGGTLDLVATFSHHSTALRCTTGVGPWTALVSIVHCGAV